MLSDDEGSRVRLKKNTLLAITCEIIANMLITNAIFVAEYSSNLHEEHSELLVELIDKKPALVLDQVMDDLKSNFMGSNLEHSNQKQFYMTSCLDLGINISDGIDQLQQKDETETTIRAQIFQFEEVYLSLVVLHDIFTGKMHQSHQSHSSTKENEEVLLWWCQ
ncbi:hypothetical protein K501DRAFT_265277 [Backusella circina FSU 941]|nr:hypothetical protein K501DRAFT_265277 [Backusella circina FSU 941]